MAFIKVFVIDRRPRRGIGKPKTTILPFFWNFDLRSGTIVILGLTVYFGLRFLYFIAMVHKIGFLDEFGDYCPPIAAKGGFLTSNHYGPKAAVITEEALVNDVAVVVAIEALNMLKVNLVYLNLFHEILS